MQLELDLVYKFNPFISLKNTKNFSFLAWNEKYEDSTLINVFLNILQIKQDLFKNLILDNLVLYKQFKTKKKLYFKKKLLLS